MLRLSDNDEGEGGGVMLSTSMTSGNNSDQLLSNRSKYRYKKKCDQYQLSKRSNNYNAACRSYSYKKNNNNHHHHHHHHTNVSSIKSSLNIDNKQDNFVVSQSTKDDQHHPTLNKDDDVGDMGKVMKIRKRHILDQFEPINIKISKNLSQDQKQQSLSSNMEEKQASQTIENTPEVGVDSNASKQVTTATQKPLLILSKSNISKLSSNEIKVMDGKEVIAIPVIKTPMIISANRNVIVKRIINPTNQSQNNDNRNYNDENQSKVNSGLKLISITANSDENNDVMTNNSNHLLQVVVVISYEVVLYQSFDHS